MKHGKFVQNQRLENRAKSIPGVILKPEDEDFIPSPDEVARRAYFAYVNEGSPDGREVQHWLVAEAEMIAERNLTRVHGFHNRT